MGVRINFSRGGNVEILLVPYTLLTMQCKWACTKLFISLCWMDLNSQSFFWNVFCTSAIRNAFSFQKLPNIMTYLQNVLEKMDIRQFKNNQQPEQHEWGKNKKVRHSRKTV